VYCYEPEGSPEFYFHTVSLDTETPPKEATDWVKAAGRGFVRLAKPDERPTNPTNHNRVDLEQLADDVAEFRDQKPLACEDDLPTVGRSGRPIRYLTPGERAKQGSQICPYHNAICDSKSEGIFTRYYCPVPSCDFSPKVNRPKAHPPVPRKDFSARP
jgi:hypothetical protein